MADTTNPRIERIRDDLDRARQKRERLADSVVQMERAIEALEALLAAEITRAEEAMHPADPAPGGG